MHEITELERIVEALLFSADKPLSVEELAKMIRNGIASSSLEQPATAPDASANVSKEDILRALEMLRDAFANHALILQEIAGGWRLGAAPQYAPWTRIAYGEAGKSKNIRLSQPALETLSIIAYRQPLSRAGIEAVRGVAVGGVLETLLERQIIRVAGRADVPGRPLLYETTPLFLEHFGLRSLDELPNVEELKRVKLPVLQETETAQKELIHETPDTAT
ncbi:MAG: SMC-Scp complex subunit ScpB [bacterium]